MWCLLSPCWELCPCEQRLTSLFYFSRIKWSQLVVWKPCSYYSRGRTQKHFFGFHFHQPRCRFQKTPRRISHIHVDMSHGACASVGAPRAHWCGLSLKCPAAAPRSTITSSGCPLYFLPGVWTVHEFSFALTLYRNRCKWPIYGNLIAIGVFCISSQGVKIQKSNPVLTKITLPLISEDYIR